jgi:hypothetical protein
LGWGKSRESRFIQFKSLIKCVSGDSASLEVTPNTSWPDVVYYNSFTHPNMGWKIHIVDTFAKSVAPTLSYSFLGVLFSMATNIFFRTSLLI